MLITMNRLVGVYVGLALATIATLAVLADVEPRLATDEAWGHGAMVAVPAVQDAIAADLDLLLTGMAQGGR